MLVRNKIGLSVGVLGCLALVTASMLLWTAARSSYNQARTALAYEELGSYLMLNGAVFRTFKQVRRDLLDGEEILRFDFEEAVNEIAGYLDSIERNVRAEAALTENETVTAELAAIDNIRSELDLTFAEVRYAMQLLDSGERIQARRLLNRTLASRIDGTVAVIIEDSIALERGQVAASSTEVELVNQLSFWVAIGMVIVAITTTFFVLTTLVVRVNSGLRVLAIGADRFAENKLDHNIELAGSDEFSQLGARFNSMAERIRTKQTDLTHAKKKLENAHKSLQHRDALRRQFFADIGHELRTPVAAIRGEAEVALRSKNDKFEAYENALSRIVCITEQLTKNVGDLFLIAREQAGVLDLRLEPVDLALVGQDAADHMGSIFAKAHVSVDINVPNTPTIIQGDRQKLVQLVTILLSNAATHSGEHAQIALELQKTEAGDVLLTVSDDGPGIPVEERHDVFERYFRGTGASRSGTGLGLPIARSLTQAHGGKISVCDASLGGACFCVEFPSIAEVG